MDEKSRFEKPLRKIFLTLLGLTVLAAGVQNILFGYRDLNAPGDLFAQTAERLMAQQQALASELLDRAADGIQADKVLRHAILQRSTAQVAEFSNRMLAEQSGDIDIAEFAVYAQDRALLYKTAGPGASDPALPVKIPSRDPGGTEDRLTVSLNRPLFSHGHAFGHLELTLDVAPALTIASSAAGGELLKVSKDRVSRLQIATTAGHAGAGGLEISGFENEVRDSARGQPRGSDGFIWQNGRIILARTLPAKMLAGNSPHRLVLAMDVTEDVWTFLKRTFWSVAIGTGLVLAAWAAVSRLMSRMQTSVKLTESRLEDEVRENSEKLKHSALQLLEAQRVAGVGSWELDLNTNEIHASEEFFRIMGIAADTPPKEIREIIFRSVLPDDAVRIRGLFDQAIADCGEFEFEHPLFLKDGTTRYLHTRGYVLTGPDGKAATFFGVAHDITERWQAERRNKLLASILETSLNEICILDADSLEIEYANKRTHTNLGYAPEELKHRPIWEINPVYDKETVRQKIAPLLSGQEANLSAEIQHVRKDGSKYPVDLRVQLMSDHQRKLIVAIANDISERVQREQETRDAKIRAERLAYFDPLTKLSNRRACQHDAAERFAGTEKPSFLFHVDLDAFKRVNDTLGHLAGDYCLEETGRRLREISRGLGTPYRWGGDEFVIIADSSTADPNVLCERARRVMRMPMEFNGNQFWPTVSMGIALCPENGADFDTLLVHADLALYHSKEHGKDRFTFFSPNMKRDSEKEAQIELELHRAIQNDEFFLVFQPQVNLRSHTVTGVEALVRWQHPERGELPPSEFLPFIERTRLAPILGELVIDKSLAAARAWLDAGLEFGRIGINISQSHLAAGSLVEHFKTAMRKYNIEPERVTAEVVESVFLDDNRSGCLTALKELFALGIHIELDDFGTGYASLTHVADLPIKGLKIDRSFTLQMLHDDRKATVINQLIGLARSLNVRVVCEGVETEAQYDCLKLMGDFSIQGYLIARPMPFDRMTDWMSESAGDLYFVI
ncbi:EAL domain-containing protein [Labrenzia aggregata]|uniref:EAL domain-containing protein n=2 Tax=Roseibium aggregatum TaxID=187304 RepID=A0A939EBL7_9HYPH|nr:EAL domain-containing protein [Roseibium aggregatum]